MYRMIYSSVALGGKFSGAFGGGLRLKIMELIC